MLRWVSVYFCSLSMSPTTFFFVYSEFQIHLIFLEISLNDFYEETSALEVNLCLHFFYLNNFTQDLIDYFLTHGRLIFNIFYDRHTGTWWQRVSNLNIYEIFSFLVVIFVRDVAQCNEYKHCNCRCHEYGEVVNFLVNVVVTSPYLKNTN
mgnify:CR=1 FL=1